MAVDECVSAWGSDLLAYLLGAGLDGPLAEWRLDAAVDEPSGNTRLWAAFELARLFSGTAAARAWVRQHRVQLSGLRPADVIRKGNEEDIRHVLELAEQIA